MPIGQPDSPQPADREERPAPFIERIIVAAMEAGDFEDLPGEGKPIPGAGTVDDDRWWVRSWIERNRDPDQDKRSE